jgi:hypothetical protein
MTMPSDESTSLTILCEAQVMNGPMQHATLEFEFGDVVADYAGLWVSLRAGANNISDSALVTCGHIQGVSPRTTFDRFEMRLGGTHDSRTTIGLTAS